MAETKMQLVDWLDDLCVRFIINLPHEELTSVERICFQIEEAQWFYEDFIRAQDPQLPQMNLRRFCELIFQHCPLLAPFQASAALSYAEFLAYKTRVPVRGAILLNSDMTAVVLVKGWNKKAKWSFPRGKINKEEKDLDCAIREVYEETGYDVREAGLVAENEADIKFIDMSLREQQMRLYVFRDVPMDTRFEPKTRKEISKIGWFKVSDLAATGSQKHNSGGQGQQPSGTNVSQDGLKSSQFYMVAPFIRPLKHWIKQQRKLDAQNGRKTQKVITEESEAEGLQAPNPTTYDDGMMTTDAEDETHFQKLLSGLQAGSQRPSVSQSEPGPAAASTADLSAQLKAMLSVGGPAAPPAQQQLDSNPLMSMLRSKPQVGGMPPHTPLEQITSTPPQANTPHHHHSHPPQHLEVSHGPPPPFPISPPQMHHGPPPPIPQGPPGPWPGQSSEPFHAQLRQLHPSHYTGHRQPGPPPPQHEHQRTLFGTNIPAPPPPTQVSNPLQTGDPAFRSQHFPQYNHAPASLPIPKPAPEKLSTHAMNLLSAFKSPTATTVQPVQPQTHGSLPELATEQPSNLVLPTERVTRAGAVLPTSSQEQNQQRSPEMEIHQPQAQRSRNAHQESLLSLFKKAEIPAQPPSQALQPPPRDIVHGRDAEPVELAAQPSPHMSREVVTKPVQHKLSMRRLPQVNTTVAATTSADEHSSKTPQLTSATVSGPLNAPDFETVKKSQPVRPVELGNGILSPSPGTAVSSPPSASGIGIRSGALRSESASMRQTATPPVPIHTVSQNVVMEAPRPFHPTTILRRSAKDIAEMARAEEDNPQMSVLQPQHHAPASAPQQAIPQPVGQVPQQQSQPRSQIPAFDRRDSSSLAQKNALLNLFRETSERAKPDVAPAQRSPAEFPGSLPVSGFPSGHGRTSGIGSPVSPIPMHLPHRQNTAEAQYSHQPSLEPTPRSSRISSLNSMPNEVSTLPSYAVGAALGTPLVGGVTSAPQSKPTPPVKRGSIASEQGGSGTQSPITPVEKNFLLGYLQGVVTKEKENNARANRQGGLQR
ncbi:uncharacterized protein PV09_05038 [Verruconis gallopava]|uniref:Nudix hydrolase domain-containing protein n=1 Tax=Verruconis gallopava TaxID=253628 RepID=A0A0D2AAU7_9PEZI|nr:uncharacterized protein PV09_05038 [Verruconis gallopava]KIW03730.1 hypothetical protein PV09_05038 [Verruconis gallopava]